MKLKLIIGACLLIAMSAVALFLNNRGAKPELRNVVVKAVDSGKRVSQKQQTESQDTSKADEPSSVSASDHLVDEQRATQRMYLAHAPLRLPEVADPDSETNRVILQTMVQKALARQTETEAASRKATQPLH